MSKNPMFETFRESRRRKTEKDLANYNNPNYQAKEEFDTLKILSLLNNTQNHQASDFKFKDSLIKKPDFSKILDQTGAVKQE